MSNNEITLYDKIANPIEAVEKMGKWFHSSGMFGCKSVDQGMVLAMACIAERRNPIEIARTYHIIDGRLSMRADAALAEFNNRGGRHVVVAQTPERAAIKLIKDGHETDFSFTWEDAQKERYPYTGKVDNDKKPILKDNWSTPRQRALMLWARCVTNGVRTVDPAVMAGYYETTEIEDLPAVAAPAKPLFPSQPPAPVSEAQPVAAEVVETATQEAEERREAYILDLKTALGPDGVATATSWLIGNGRLSAGQTISDLTLPQVEKIVNNLSAFEAAIGLKKAEAAAHAE